MFSDIQSLSLVCFKFSNFQINLLKNSRFVFGNHWSIRYGMGLIRTQAWHVHTPIVWLAEYWLKLRIHSRISLTSASSFPYHLDLSTKLQINFDKNFICWKICNIILCYPWIMNHGDDNQMEQLKMSSTDFRFKSQLIQDQFQTYGSMGKRPQTK